jgi:hypothetical protein
LTLLPVPLLRQFQADVCFGGLAKETNGLKIVVFLPFCIVQVEYFFSFSESIAFCLESSAGIY